MSSLCIKTNDEDILTYLNNEFTEFNMLNVFYSQHEFKSYKNIIIHYTGIDNELFYTKLATIFSYLVIDHFEKNIVKNILQSNYFYFNLAEHHTILDLCAENLCDSDEYSFPNRQMLIFDAFYEYITTHHSIVLSGFITFRLSEYRNLLENLIDFSVNSFIIEREYLEFISLLKLYINSQASTIKEIHLLSLEGDTILLDKDMKEIYIDKTILNAKYLSDVSFSNNDHVLNTLLNLLPQKIYIHLVEPLCNLDFINTLQLIFEKRIEFCSDCNICNLYKHVKKNKSGIEK